MIIISHRGNFDGKNVETENAPQQIEFLLSKNIPVKIDVRFNNGRWHLDHDHGYGQSIVGEKYLLDRKEMLWCHAKDILGFEKMLALGLHCFWNKEDHYTLTSKGIIWAQPNQYVEKGILFMPSKEFLNSMKKPIYGICVDNVKDYL